YRVKRATYSTDSKELPLTLEMWHDDPVQYRS
uniref:Uncharacterized protein n=1 Tax=Aegilops tauschii subsp. strangulata TaxID=200361 RepID=A0A453QZL6_AEGTS